MKQFLLPILFALSSVHGAPFDPSRFAPQSPPPEVEKVLGPLAEYYRSAERVSGTMQVTRNIDMESSKQELTSKYTFAFERPNRLALIARDGMMAYTFVTDGKQLTTYQATLKRYSVANAPDSLTELAKTTEAMMSGQQNLAAFLSLFASDPHAAILNGVIKASHSGGEQVDGAECDHLVFEQLGMRWEAWIVRGQKPEVRRIVTFMDMAEITKEFEGTKLPGAMPEFSKMKVRAQVDFADWKFNEALPADTFQFTPPEGAKKEEPRPRLGVPKRAEKPKEAK